MAYQQTFTCSNSTIETLQKSVTCQWRYSGAFTVNFEHISHHVLVFLLLTLGRYMSAGLVPLEIINFLEIESGIELVDKLCSD